MIDHELEITEHNRQQTMDAWTEARADAAKILAEQGKRADWEGWAEQQIGACSNSAMVRKIIFDR